VLFDLGNNSFNVFQEEDILAEDRGVDVADRETDDVWPGRFEERYDVTRRVFAEREVQDGDMVTGLLER